MKLLVKEGERIEESEFTLEVEGKGSKFLSDDGTYKTISSGGGLRVIEYDPSLEVNKNSRDITLLDFKSEDDSCTITKDYIEVRLDKVKRTAIINETGEEVTKEYVLASLDLIPSGLKINVDYNNYRGVLLNFGFKRQESSYESFIRDIIYGNDRYNYPREFSSISLEEWAEGSYSTDSIAGNFKYTDPFSTSAGMSEGSSLVPVTDLEDLERTFRLAKFIESLYVETGTSNKEELIAYLKAMGWYTPELEETINNSEKHTSLLLETKGEEGFNWVCPMPSTVDQMYIIILSESVFGNSQKDSAFEDVYRFNISIEGEHIVEWYLPEEVEDGDLLEIKGDCYLLGNSLQEGDYLLIAENKTKGIKLKGT